MASEKVGNWIEIPCTTFCDSPGVGGTVEMSNLEVLMKRFNGRIEYVPYFSWHRDNEKIDKEIPPEYRIVCTNDRFGTSTLWGRIEDAEIQEIIDAIENYPSLDDENLAELEHRLLVEYLLELVEEFRDDLDLDSDELPDGETLVDEALSVIEEEDLTVEYFSGSECYLKAPDRNAIIARWKEMTR